MSTTLVVLEVSTQSNAIQSKARESQRMPTQFKMPVSDIYHQGVVRCVPEQCLCRSAVRKHTSGTCYQGLPYRDICPPMNPCASKTPSMAKGKHSILGPTACEKRKLSRTNHVTCSEDSLRHSCLNICAVTSIVPKWSPLGLQIQIKSRIRRQICAETEI